MFLLPSGLHVAILYHIISYQGHDPCALIYSDSVTDEDSASSRASDSANDFE